MFDSERGYIFVNVCGNTVSVFDAYWFTLSKVHSTAFCSWSQLLTRLITRNWFMGEWHKDKETSHEAWFRAWRNGQKVFMLPRMPTPPDSSDM